MFRRLGHAVAYKKRAATVKRSRRLLGGFLFVCDVLIPTGTGQTNPNPVNAKVLTIEMILTFAVFVALQTRHADSPYNS